MKMTINIDPELHHRLKIAAAECSLTIREVVSALVSGYVNSIPRERGKAASATERDQ